MERHKITAQEAFLMLVRASQATHRSVAGLAQDLVESGEWPPSGSGLHRQL
jgi:hypothetical protein